MSHTHKAFHTNSQGMYSVWNSKIEKKAVSREKKLKHFKHIPSLLTFSQKCTNLLVAIAFFFSNFEWRLILFRNYNLLRIQFQSEQSPTMLCICVSKMLLFRDRICKKKEPKVKWGFQLKKYTYIGKNDILILSFMKSSQKSTEKIKKKCVTLPMHYCTSLYLIRFVINNTRKFENSI